MLGGQKNKLSKKIPASHDLLALGSFLPSELPGRWLVSPSGIQSSISQISPGPAKRPVKDVLRCFFSLAKNLLKKLMKKGLCADLLLAELLEECRILCYALIACIKAFGFHQVFTTFLQVALAAIWTVLALPVSHPPSKPCWVTESSWP